MQWFRQRALVTVALAALAVGTAGCGARQANRGNLPTESQMAKIEVGKSTKSQVSNAIGTPSTVGTFDDQVWYYISRKTSKWGFLEEEVLDQQVLAMYFDEKGTLQHIERYTMDDSRNIELVSRETPTAGHSLGFFEQILGNFGRFGGGGGAPGGF